MDKKQFRNLQLGQRVTHPDYGGMMTMNALRVFSVERDEDYYVWRIRASIRFDGEYIERTWTIDDPDIANLRWDNRQRK